MARLFLLIFELIDYLKWVLIYYGTLGFGDYLDAGLPVAKSAPNPYIIKTFG
jgi:hypothetical protein